ncbi:MAG: tetratricopeptide repeat protein [Candidatus Edwardsbacteria bacterium]
MRKKKIFILTPLLVISLISLSLASEKWYDYYQEGLNYMKQGEWEKAIEEFKSAISLEFKDQEKIQLNEIQFLDYFPHREMGICYYNFGDYENARKELELSSAFASSARTQEFIARISEAPPPPPIVKPPLPPIAKPVVEQPRLTKKPLFSMQNFDLQIEGFTQKVTGNTRFRIVWGEYGYWTGYSSLVFPLDGYRIGLKATAFTKKVLPESDFKLGLDLSYAALLTNCRYYVFANFYDKNIYE